MTLPQFFAEHHPFIRDWSGAAAPVAAPPVAGSPQPGSLLTVQSADELYLIAGPMGGRTLAAIAGADPAPTVRVDSGPPSLSAAITWSAGSGLVTTSGVHVGPSARHRMRLTYVGSAGEIRGGSTHDIVVVNQASLFSVVSQLGLAGRVGVEADAVVAELSHPNAIEVEATPMANAMGMGVELDWTPGTPSTGQLRLVGAPNRPGTVTLRVQYKWEGLVLGQSTHTVAVGAHSTPATPASIPAPAPAAPPALPSAPGLRASSIQFADEHIGQVLMVLNGSEPRGAPEGLPLDVQRRFPLWEAPLFPSATEVWGIYPTAMDGVAGFGFAASGGELSSQHPGRIAIGQHAAIGGEWAMLGDGDMTIECYLRLSSGAGLWDAGHDTRWLPAVSQVKRNELSGMDEGWTLGMLSRLEGEDRVVRPAIIVTMHDIMEQQLTQEFGQNSFDEFFGLAMAVGQPVSGPWPGWKHLAGQWMVGVGGVRHLGCWLDGDGGSPLTQAECLVIGGRPGRARIYLSSFEPGVLVRHPRATQQMRSARIMRLNGDGIGGMRITRMARYPMAGGLTGSFNAGLLPSVWPEP